MIENQDFLSPSQCFIVYDKYTRKIALSIRNRLSKEHIKCTAWDGDTFKQNEARMSNFNRILILNKEFADEYLANPEINKEISDHVIYRREGRVASLTLAEDGTEYDELYEKLKPATEQIQKLSAEEKNILMTATPGEIAELWHINNVICLPTKIEQKNDLSPVEEEKRDKIKYTLKTIATYAGVGAVATLFPISTAAIISSFLIIGFTDSKKSTGKCKEILLFASALVFEEQYINDFVNAE